ncbi:flavin-containing monooxygenase [Methylocucumis oryzae]|uniref:flavin-containing monooxygenase n=1 Tax=Methylocucumis oryzae TaxID=1632867 RepID=UPI000696479F|nr:NAD(P)/FAD-dependent oxidoreductase [Methylocucumis oryzae]
MNTHTEQPTNFNLAALKNKYRHERDKRLRADGILQYRLIDEPLQTFVADPYMPVSARPARYDDVQVLIVGGGFSGLMTAAKLKQAGINQVCIVERGGDFGGTWYWNRYPGAQCDVESYIYLPLLEELGYMPKQKYSYAREIFAHCQALGRHYQLYDEACFHTLVTELRWDATTARWQVTTDRGDRLSAQFVCLADGPLSQPKLPGIAGLERFQGKMFHTSRWDYEYTGGADDERLVKLADKRIAVIGTGATGIQCVPVLAEYAQQLYVFQRTPSSVFCPR